MANVTLNSYLVVTEPLDVNEHQMWQAVGHDSRTKYTEDEVRTIIRSVLKWGRIFNTRVSLSWAQMLHETGAFRYGGQVVPEQWNFAGIGSTNDGARGRYFPSIDEGVLAFFCHRALYQWGEKKDWPIHLQPYFDKAIRYGPVRDAGYLGVCTVVGDFTNGRWAWSPQYPRGTLLNGYANAMVRGANNILSKDRGQKEEAPPAGAPSAPGATNDLTADILRFIKQHGVETHDIRNQMPTRGSYSWKGRDWNHVAVHYTGVWRERNTLQAEINSWRGHATYHVNTHRWPGIAYAIGISPSGRVFGLRDAERIGYHAFNANAISLGISCDMTYGQKPTPELMKALNAVLRALDAYLPNYKHSGTWGHQELKWHDSRNSTTLCPGNFLLPTTATYRATGKDFALTLPPQTVTPDPSHAKVEVPGHGTFWIIGNIFKAWTQVGGNVLVFGYPLTGMFEENGENVQYFERSVLREKPEGYWPDNFDVDFEAVGRVVAEHRYDVANHPAFQRLAWFPDTEARVWRPETGHTMSTGFLSYWRRYGDIKLFGWPISEEFEEDGKTVQYFERARFEWAPGTDPARFDVQLGRLGAEVLDIRRGNTT